MNTAAWLEQLRPSIQQKIHHGEFLLSTNTFSTTWIGEVTSVVTAPLLCNILTAFWRSYLIRRPGAYVLVTLEPFGTTAHKEAPLTILVREVVAQVNHPALQFQPALFDPDSFEIELDMSAPDARLFIVVEPSAPHDLLVALCQHVQMFGGAIAGMITLVESEHLQRAALQETFGVPVIPLFVYDTRPDTLSSVLDLTEEPYLEYQSYFAMHAPI